MKEDLIDEILDAIVPALETSQAQSAALFQILQQKKVLSNEEYTRLVEQASNAADIKIRASRLRLKRVLTSAIEELERAKESNQRERAAPAEKRTEGPEPDSQAEESKYGKPSATKESSDKPDSRRKQAEPSRVAPREGQDADAKPAEHPHQEKAS